LRFTDRFYTNDVNTQYAPGYAIMNWRLGFKQEFGKLLLREFVRVDNIFNREYIGSVIVMAAAGLVAFLQFNGVQVALLVGGTSLLIHTLVGNLLVPWLTSRTSRMNPVAVFVGVIFWGWLWGIWGLLLGIPIMMVAKAVCDHVEDLEPIGELLGD